MQLQSTVADVRRAPDYPHLRAAATAVWRGASRLARRRVLAPISVAVFALTVRSVLLLWIPVPKPAIPDEFSNLLLGDTLASGRLANPQHPLWVHFETQHVISHPTYASKYPPLQGAVLAAGQSLLGHPWCGVLLAAGTMCGVLCWAIQGWLPPIWGLVGSLLALLQIGVASYWTDSYWGGAHSAIAGALVIGAVPRLVRNPRWPAAVAYASGLSLLANCRPYEGVVLGVITGAVLIAGLWSRFRKGRTNRTQIFRHVVIPAALVIAPTVLWMGYYNYRTTTDPLLMPYVLHERQYAVWSMFIWGGPRPAPAYNHEVLKAFWVGWDGDCKRAEHSNVWFIRRVDLLRLGLFFLGVPLIGWVLIALPNLARCRRTRLPLVLLILFYAAAALLTRIQPHYFAPATALVYVVSAGAVRLAWRKQSSREMAAVFLVLVAVVAVIRMAAPDSRFLFDKRQFLENREAVLRRLTAVPGQHLVIARYGPNHEVNDEWVFNRADLDRADIVWAHFMGPERDRELLDYYRNRRVWLLDENDGVRLRPYSHVFPGPAPGVGR